MAPEIKTEKTPVGNPVGNPTVKPVESTIVVEATVGQGDTKKTGKAIVKGNFSTIEGLKSYGLTDAQIADCARKALIISIQAEIRKQVEAGKSPDEVQSSIDNWKYGTVVRTGGKPNLETFKSKLNAFTPEELLELKKSADAAIAAFKK